VAAVIYVGLCGFLFLVQRNLLYYPQPGSMNRSAEMTMVQPDGTTILVTTRFLDGPEAVIYFGGNAEDVTDSLPDFSAIFRGRSLYLMNYRGYGGSGGSPSEQTLFADAFALYDRISQVHPRVTVIGRSLGSAVAIKLASERPVTQLVLVTPFDSVQNIAARQFPYLPVRLLLRDKFESWRYAPRVRAPTRVLAAANDNVVPLKRTGALLEHFPPYAVTLKVVEGADHNSIASDPRYLDWLAAPPNVSLD